MHVNPERPIQWSCASVIFSNKEMVDQNWLLISDLAIVQAVKRIHFEMIKRWPGAAAHPGQTWCDRTHSLEGLLKDV